MTQNNIEKRLSLVEDMLESACAEVVKLKKITKIHTEIVDKLNTNLNKINNNKRR